MVYEYLGYGHGLSFVIAYIVMVYVVMAYVVMVYVVMAYIVMARLQIRQGAHTTRPPEPARRP